MAIKIKIPGPKRSKAGRGRAVVQPGILGRVPDAALKATLAAFILICLIFFGVFSFYYVKYEKLVDQRMNGPIFSKSAQIYARPSSLHPGEAISVQEIAGELEGAGYSSRKGNAESKLGSYRLSERSIEVRPGPDSMHGDYPVTISIEGGKISRIVPNRSGQNVDDQLAAYELEPRLLTALFSGDQRTKRQIVHFQDIPKVMVDATLAIEDRRFFEHSGVNYFRLLEAGLIDLHSHGRSQGASTLTMQMARAFFLTPQKTLKRKTLEILIAFELENKFSKKQIFEIYANQVDLGQRGSYAIVGFAEAARAYFNKDLQSITLPEAALLAGIIQRPSYLSPYRHPDRALERRNLVLDSMVETSAVTRAQADAAKATGLNLAPPNVEASDAPYFVDVVKDQLNQQFSEQELNGSAYKVYTTIDPELQKAAAEAVQMGSKLVDEQVQKQRVKHKKQTLAAGSKGEKIEGGGASAMPQVALVALDPHTGEVLALVGGRNYGFSQLNHALAKRPTGSIFKPFVYAAAVATGIDAEPDTAETPVTLVDDSPGTFTIGDKIYEPRNYKDEYHGEVPLRYALAQSLNNATIKVAEQTGYARVAQLARAAGITSVRATPAMALGAYDATPLEMAGAYTVFANQGARLAPRLLRSVRNSKGEVLAAYHSDTKPVLDARVAYVMTSMMEGVLNYGTGYEVRRRGFAAPAAGKTGTSHDAWFAGYTSNLLCIVWVGNDDYSDLHLSGSQTAAPIWAEFMKKAVKLPGYREVREFPQPSGVVQVQIDKATNRLSTSACPQAVSVAFIEGTEPMETCEQEPGDHKNFVQRLLGSSSSPPQLPPASQTVVIKRAPPGMPPVQNADAESSSTLEQDTPPNKKKKGFLGKIVGIFK